MRWIWACALAWIAIMSASQATELRGRLEQGGLALGQARPGADIRLDGRSVPTDSEGRFALGFGRDAPAQAVLEIDGRRQVLNVAPRAWKIQRIDGLPPAKVTPDPSDLARIKAENQLVTARREIVTPIAQFLDGIAVPADGPVSGVFGSQRVLNGEGRAPHSGTDIAAQAGSPVRALASGTVTLAHPGMFFTGLTAMVDHGLGVQSVYAHLSRLDVVEGQHVEKGQVIGTVGASGRATGPHLHWGVSWLDVRLDPETVLAVLSSP